jgi:hypothetical protein
VPGVQFAPPTLRVGLAVLATLTLVVPAAGAGGFRRDCRGRCAVHIEACIAERGAALVDAGATGARLRRKARRIRRQCARRAWASCRRFGPDACQVPLACACS